MATAIASLCALACSPEVLGVYLSSDSVGQALIYPYYTTQTVNGDSYNTYVTVVNQTTDVKAVRVRFREGRAGREVAAFNLFLSPGDTWAAALSTVAATGAARLTTVDRSCVSPAFTSSGSDPVGVVFSNAQYSGSSADLGGAGLDRTREGWVEMLEMGTVSGDVAAAVTHGTNGVPTNCGVVQGSPSITASAPTGGLSGTLTLINVANGLNFTINAEALADLASRPYYRPASDAYPDFNVAEIDSVSAVIANGYLYRSNWSRGADAVTATLMRSSWLGELILDSGTRSNTDFVMTFPMRPYFFSGGNFGPFAEQCTFNDEVLSSEPVMVRFADREEAASTEGRGLTCSASGVVSFTHPGGNSNMPTLVLGSNNWATKGSATFNVPNSLQSGWASMTRLDRTPPFTSLATSTRTNIATGAVTAGAHAYYGLPVVGFSARTFSNGALACNSGTCMGNYGGLYPFKYARKIVTP